MTTNPTTSRRAPSPFLFGWNSVDPKSYPYTIPTTKKRARKGTSKPITEGNKTIVVGGTKTPRLSISTTSEATQLQSPPPPPPPPATANHIPVSNNNLVVKKKTPALFIPKPKKPTRRNATLIPEPSIEEITPSSINLAHQDDPNKDPFGWGSPREKEQEEDPSGREGEEEGRSQEQEEKSVEGNGEETKETEIKELEKPLKLDGNLLEIIIRMVFVQVKMIDSLTTHNEILDVLNGFKKQCRGLYKKHSSMFENKLTEAVNKRKAIEFEYKQVSGTIEEELKKSIESSVSKHKKILSAPSLDLRNGLFGDDWLPKPVTYLDSSAISNPIHIDDHFNSTLDPPIKSFAPSNHRQDAIKPSDNNSDPWGWGDSADNMATDPKPASKPVECPWGADEPEEVTNKPKEPVTTTNGDDSFGWGSGGGGGNNNAGGGDSWGGKSNNNDAGGWTSGNHENDSGGGSWGQQQSFNSGDNNNGFETRPRDTGWSGRGRGGRGGGFSQDGQSGFRGRGRGFGGDGFRGGRSRGFDGGGFGGGRGRGFGNRNGFTGGNSNGFGDSGSNNGWNNGFTDGFNSGNGNGFGDSNKGFGGGFNSNKGGWGESNNAGFGDSGTGSKSGWGDGNGSKGGWGDGNGSKGGWGDGGGSKSGWGDTNGTQNGFGNTGNGTKGDSSFKSGWDDSGNDLNNGFNASRKPGGGGRGEGQGFKTGGGGGGGGAGEGWQSPTVSTNRPIVHYDAIAPETSNNGNDWGATNGNSSATTQPNASEGHQAKDVSTNDDNGWGSPPPKEQVNISSNGSKPFKHYDDGPSVDNLPINLDYGGDMLVDRTDPVVNSTIPHQSIQEASKTDPVNTVSTTKPVAGNDENECPW